MLQEIKDYLKITWNDEDTTIQGIIARGQYNLNELVGAELDFLIEGQARSLLFNYCRYDYNNAVEYFEENFHREIMRLQLNTGISLLACLFDLAIEGLTLSPEFDSRNYEYTATTTDESNVITAKPISEDAIIDITVNDTEHENNTAYSWNNGDNVIEFTVTDGKQIKTYAVTVTKS